MRVAFATKHGKEAQVGPVLARLGLQVRAVAVDTDALGTFTGSVARAGTALEAARRKAELALQSDDEADFGLGSEGSFGPHPAMPWLAVDRELLVLSAREPGLELIAEVSSLETNWASTTARTLETARAFAERIGFPSHALVVDGVVGVFDAQVFERALALRGEVTLSSDARAHCNPSRQRVITACAEQLAHAWAARCPSCGARGFVAREAVPGLPCRECGAPTRLPTRHLARCRCGLVHEVPVLAEADPGVCSRCNP